MEQTIGILGGLGPHAHIHFERCLLERCEVRSEQEYPRWVVLSCPQIPDRTLALEGQGPSPVPAMTEALAQLATLADLAVIPCNTAHAFLDQLESPLPVVHLIGETLRGLPPDATLGLLGTTGTMRSRIYQRTGPSRSWVTLLDLPDGERLHEELVMRPIYGPRSSPPCGPERRGARAGGIKSGTSEDPETGRPHRHALQDAVDRLLAAGATHVIAGCTEIPLALPRGGALVDPMWETAGAVLRRLGRQPRATAASPNPGTPAGNNTRSAP